MSHDLIAKYLKKIDFTDFTDFSVYRELSLPTAHLKVNLTKNPIKPYEQHLFTKHFLCRYMSGLLAIPPINFIDY